MLFFKRVRLKRASDFRLSLLLKLRAYYMTSAIHPSAIWASLRFASGSKRISGPCPKRGKRRACPAAIVTRHYQALVNFDGNAQAFVRTVRTECLDWLLVLNQPHLEHVLRVFIDHYNVHRPHRSLGLIPPEPPQPTPPIWCGGHIQQRDRLGGVIHEYAIAA